MEDIILIHSYSTLQPLIETNKEGGPFADGFAETLAKFARFLAYGALIFLVISYTPAVWYELKGSVQDVSSLLAQTASKVEVSEPLPYQVEYQPRFDATLPMESNISIPSIGIDSTLSEATLANYEDALKKGIWRVSDFGTPFARENPTILAAHRYGYLNWNNLFRRKSSFYNLPELEEGELIEVTWRQRKYTYEVYASSEGEEIKDYSADLILYTCESLSSPVRIFKYARLIEV